MRGLERTLMGGAAALLLFWAGGAAAQTAPTDPGTDSGCRLECGQALKECRRAAVHAYRFCLGNCQEAIAAAESAARQTCRDEGLSLRQCARVVKRAITAAARGCRQECRAAFTLARAVCKEGLHECRDACGPFADPACVDQCRGDFGICRDELGMCRDTCFADLDAAIQACRETLADVCDPFAFRECVQAAKRDAHACLAGCDDEFSCAGDLRDCLLECRDPALTP